MDKKVITPLKRIMSVLLCIAMVLPMLVVSASAERIPSSDKPLAIIYAASDFQVKKADGTDDYETAANVMNKIIKTVKANHSRMDGAFFLGDYSVNYNNPYTNAGRTAVRDVIVGAWSNLQGGSNIIYVQGNHDDSSYSGRETNKTQDLGQYTVFVMDEDMFPWQQGKSANAEANKKTVEDTANMLETFLQGRLDANDDRPVFITSHIPLHYSHRSNSGSNYDNTYSKLIFDVLNEYGKNLDIIFLFGHNHSSTYDDYIGGAAIYLPVGDTIYIPVENSAGKYTEHELNFTYMNGGYIGYYKGNCETQQSSSVFEIYEDRIEIARYDANGEANLKDEGVATSAISVPNTTVYTNNSPEATIQRRKPGVQMDYGTLNSGKLIKDGSGILTIKGEYGSSYSVSWSTNNTNAVEVKPSADGMSAKIIGKAAGTAKVTATITEISTAKAVGETFTRECEIQVLDIKATDPEVLIKAGNYTYFQKVQTVFAADDEEGDKVFAFIDMEKDGYTIGQQMALSKDDIFDMKENDNTTVYGTEYRPEHELNAQAVNVFQLPGTTGETLTLADIPNQNCWWTTWHEQSANTNNAQRNRVMTYRTDFANRFLVIKEDTGIFAYDSDLDRLRCKGSNPKTFGWRYNDTYGLYTHGAVADTGYSYFLYYSQANSDFSAARYDENNKLVDDSVNSRVYAFQRQTITIANDIYANLDDVTGYVNKDVGYTNLDGKRLGGAKTGDKLILKNGNETLEIDVTIDMLSGDFDVTKPGVYTGLSIEYAGATVAEGMYTLVVNDTATLLKNDAAREYLDNIYVLTDTMVPGKQYMIVDDNEAGIAHAMGVSRGQVFAYNVMVQELPVSGSDKLYIDASRYSWNTSQTTGADITESNLVGRGIVDQGDINALMSALPDTIADQRVTYQYAIRLVWSPTQLAFSNPGASTYTCNQYTPQSGYLFLMSQMQHAGYGNKFLSISGNYVNKQLQLLAEPNTENTAWYNWKYGTGVQLDESKAAFAYLFYNFQNMIGITEKDANGNSIVTDQGNKDRHDSLANQNFQTEVYGNATFPNLKNYRRTWIYERVTGIDTVSARVSDKSSTVTQRVVGKYEATSGATFTGDYILVDTTHANGTVTTEQVPMTIDMLSGGFDLTKPGTYSNLTVTYQGVEICTDYTLKVEAYVENDYPDFPDEGAVRIGKYLNTAKYNYLNTGVASIDLSVTGVPFQSGVDVVIILDTSSSMKNCVHAVAPGATCSTCGMIDNTNSRLAVLEDTLESMLTTLKEPINGYIPDIDVAIADFNGYTPINTDYMVPYNDGNKYIETNQQVTEEKPDASDILVPFTNIAELDPKCLNENTQQVDIENNAGTNYDRAMELAYELLSAKQKQNALDGVSRKSVVVFMSDGAPYQYNYFCGAANQTLWNDYLAGKLDVKKFKEDVTAQNTLLGYESDESDAVLNAFDDYYNSDGSCNKHWTAEAIKADPNSMVKVIDRDAMTRNHVTYVRGLGATMYGIGFGMARDTRIDLETIHTVMESISTDADHYKKVGENAELHAAFQEIAQMIRSGSAKDAVFHDQMGEKFDLVTSNIVGTGSKTVNLLDHNPEAPSITVKRFELYKRSEIGEEQDGVIVTEQMIGDRKYTMSGGTKVENAPTILEKVTFNDNGTEVYSNKKSGNILNGKVIEALTFFYNTDKENAHDITVNGKVVSLAPETFYWIVGDVPQDELVMSYSVYLTGSMEGNREPNTYDTNEYADLTYVNHLGTPCEQDVPTPKLPWKQGTVGYAFYLVDKEGNPIINQATGELGSFERSVEITEPKYQDFKWNETHEDNNAVTIKASDVKKDLPAGYTLFDKDAQYGVSLHSGGTGTYNVTKGEGISRATTYIQGIYEYDINYVGNFEADMYATANTIVWFAVYADPSAQPDSVVIDYGIPVDIHVMVNDPHMNTNYAELVGVGNVTNTAFSTDPEDGFALTCEGKFGTLSIVDNGKNSTNRAALRYTLNNAYGMQMNDAEKFSYAVRYYGPHGKVGYHYATVTIIPAATMYYEGDFIEFTNSTATTGDYGNWENDNSSIQISCYNQNNWTQMYAFCAEDDGAAGTWPGVKMYDSNNDNIFTAYVSADQVGKSVIFNNGDLGNATGDLQLVGNAVYKLDGSWVQNSNYSSKVYFENDAGWETVYAYWWNADDQNNGWPGTEIYKDANGLYVADVPAGMTAIIFDAGDGAPQTPDLNVEENRVYKADGSYESLPSESETKRVYFNTEVRNWKNVYAYWWNVSNENNSWPGQPMAYDSVTGLYYIDVPTTMTNIKFHDNRDGYTETLAEQTISGANTCYREPYWDHVSDTNDVIFDSTNSGWDVVYAYYWSDANTSMSAWPGVKMTKGEGNLWNLTIPSEAEWIIFNGGVSQTQTGNIALQASGTTYYADGTNNSSGSSKVYYFKGNNWDEVYAYYWYGSGENANNGGKAFPGTKMTKDSATGLYSISVPAEMHSIVFSNGKFADDQQLPGFEQTADLRLPAAPGSVFYGDKWSAYNNDLTVQDEDRPGEDANNALGNLDMDSVYGYDSHYTDIHTHSLGHASAVKVTSGKSGVAKFSFWGTGFDMVSLSSSNTGVVVVKVTDAKGNSVANYLVDTYYGYSYTDQDNDGDNEWVATPSASDNSLYQVPVIKVDLQKVLITADDPATPNVNETTYKNFGYGYYNVEVVASYGSIFDHNKSCSCEANTCTGCYDFYLDAVRIYDPANDGVNNDVNNTVIKDAYIADGEYLPTYEELRNQLIGLENFNSLGDEETAGAIFIDGNRDLTATGGNGGSKPLGSLKQPGVIEYANYGPNNELYLADNQAVAFKLNSVTNLNQVHMALKLACGNPALTVYGVDKDGKTTYIYEDVSINSATDLYYNISALIGQTVVIRNTGAEGSMLSITNIKSTYYAEGTEDQDLMTVDGGSVNMALASLEGEKDPIVSDGVIAPQSATLTYEDEILLNIYFTMEGIEASELGLMTYTADGSTLLDTIPGAVFADGQYMATTRPIAAKNLGDTVYFRVYAKLADGSYVYSKLLSYSPKTYAMNILNNSDDVAMKSLVVAMLNYGAEAQKYFGYKTEALVNADLNAEQKALVADYSADMIAPLGKVDSAKVGAFAANGGFGKKYPTVSLEGAFAINYYFENSYAMNNGMTLYYWTAEDYAKAEVLTAENATGIVNGTTVSGIAAKDLDSTIYVAAVYECNGTSYCTGVLPYSIGAFCVSNGSALAQAIAVYGNYAQAYFG